MSMIDNQHSRTAKKAATNGDLIRAADMNMVGEIAVVADCQRRVELLARMARHRVEPKIVPRREVQPDAAVPQPQQTRTSSDTEALGSELTLKKSISKPPESSSDHFLNQQPPAIFYREGHNLRSSGSGLRLLTQ